MIADGVKKLEGVRGQLQEQFKVLKSSADVAANALKLPTPSATGQTTKRNLQDKQLIEKAKEIQASLNTVNAQGEKARAEQELKANYEKQEREIKALKISAGNEKVRQQTLFNLRQVYLKQLSDLEDKFASEDLKKKLESRKQDLEDLKLNISKAVAFYGENSQQAKDAREQVFNATKQILDDEIKLLTDKQAAGKKLTDEEITRLRELQREREQLAISRKEELNKDTQYEIEQFGKRQDEIYNKEVKAANGNTELVKQAYEKRQNNIKDYLDGLVEKEQITAEQRAELEKTLLGTIGTLEDNISKTREKNIKALQDDLDVLEAQLKTLPENSKAYFAKQEEIENQSYKIRLANAQDNAKQIQAINIEHENTLKQIKLSAFVAEKEIAIQRMQVIASIGSSLQQLAGKNKALAITGIIVEKAAAIGQIWANNAIANAKATAASPLTAGQPWVTINTVAAALSTAATVAAAIKAIQEINSAGSGSQGEAAKVTGVMAKKAKGGYISGPGSTTSDSIPAMLSNGEYVVNARATEK
mgnify:CR=1 FL=1